MKTTPISSTAGEYSVYAQSEACERSRQVHALLNDAACHYRQALCESDEVIRYLRVERGISSETAARFSLGYARPAWQDLRLVLGGHSHEAALDSGLLVVKEATGARFDRFRDRVMFPIRRRNGSVAGFGGRVLGRVLGRVPGRVIGDSAPKYLNSPEGVAFRKRELLYGLFEAQDAIVAQDSAILVEGYLDVLTLAQAGIANVVGTLGTACSHEQVCELLSLTRHVVFCFDGDVAGYGAAARALDTVLSFADKHHRFEFVFLPEGHDPDSWVRQFGAAAFDEELSFAMPLSAFVLGQIERGCDLRYAEGRARCASLAQPYWTLLPSPTRDWLAEHCANVLGFSVEDTVALWERVA